MLTGHFLDDLVDLLHEDLLDKDQVVEHVCGEAVVQLPDLRVRLQYMNMSASVQTGRVRFTIIFTYIAKRARPVVPRRTYKSRNIHTE